MDPTVVLGCLVWKYLTIKEIGTLLQVSRYIRDKVTSNAMVIERITKFLQNGIRVLEYNKTHIITPNNGLRQQMFYRKQLNRLRHHQTVVLFPS